MSVLADIVAEVATEYGAGPTFSSGRLALSEHDAPPRIVAVEVEGAFAVTDRPGGRFDGAEAVRELFVRTLIVDWYCWGEDESAAETLMLDLIRTFWKAGTMGSYLPLSYRRLQQEEAEASWLTLGEVYVVRVEHQAGVTDAPGPVREAPVSGVHTGTITVPQGSGIEEVGCGGP